MIFNKIKNSGFIFVISLFCLIFSCQDLNFGDDLLKKPPSGDITIDDIYADADLARRTLWAAYQTLPYGLNLRDLYWGNRGHWPTPAQVGANGQLNQDILESITDLNHSWQLSDFNGVMLYYPGDISASRESTEPGTKYSYMGKTNDNWLGIRRSYLFIQNIDRVPSDQMSDAEKTRMKAEAKIIIAIHYFDFFRHFGGVPWIDKAYSAEDLQAVEEKPRLTALQTVNNIVELLDQAAEDLDWTLHPDEVSTWDGRLTRAAAKGIKAKVLLFAASPLFNDHQPYMDGEASTAHLTWYGSYMPEMWQRARQAHEDFFNENAGRFALLQPNHRDDVAEYRRNWQSAYLDRNTGETVVSFRGQVHMLTGNNPRNNDWVHYMRTLGDWGGSGPTQELVNAFPMKSGKGIDEDGTDFDPKYPYDNRDPRLYETVALNGDLYLGFERIEVHEACPDCDPPIPQGIHNMWLAQHQSFKNGMRMRKFILDGGMDSDNSNRPTLLQMAGRPLQWPYLRMAELYLGYAETLAMTGDMGSAYEYVDAVRDRVGVGPMTRGHTQEEFIDALLNERVCELAYEQVRWFDMIRWKRDDIFTRPLHRVQLFVLDPTEDPLVSFEYRLEELPSRYWQRTWDRRWFLSAFPSVEINKNYGLIQNPGW